MAEPRHIVIAEDESLCRRTLTLALNLAGYRVTEAQDGQEALEIIQAAREQGNKIDLLVTDLNMPRLSGPKLLAVLREANLFLPSLGITGYGDPDTLLEVLQLGCLGCLCKPFSVEELTSKIAEVFENLEKGQPCTAPSAETQNCFPPHETA